MLRISYYTDEAFPSCKNNFYLHPPKTFITNS